MNITEYDAILDQWQRANSYSDMGDHIKGLIEYYSFVSNTTFLTHLKNRSLAISYKKLDNKSDVRLLICITNYLSLPFFILFNLCCEVFLKGENMSIY